MRVLLLVALALPAGALAAERAALVVGNQDYPVDPPEAGAAEVAQAAAERLTAAGYEVTLGVDLSRSGFRRALADFADDAQDAERAVVVYVGRAGALGGATWLAPVTIEPEDALDLVRGAVPLAAPLAIAAGADATVAIIDASASGALADIPGLAVGVAPQPEEGAPLVLSATAPAAPDAAPPEVEAGFVAAALDALLGEGRTLGEALEALERARPDAYVGGRIDADVAFSPARPEEATSVERELELELWRAAERTAEPAGYRAYLDRFPRGVFAEIARARIEGAAEAPASAPAPAPDPAAQASAAAQAAEAAIALSRDERRAIQRELTEQGFDTRGVDGIFGPGSRAAIEAWQASEGREATGYLTESGAQILLAAAEARAEAERAAVEEAARAAEAALNLAQADRIDAQEALTARGYATGGTGGVFGPETREAIRAFQAGRGEPATGYLTAAQVAALQEPAPASAAELFAEAEAANTVEAYRAYLEAYPQGAQAETARARLAALESEARARAARGDAAPASPPAPASGAEAPPAEDPAAGVERALALDERSRVAVEARLGQAGFDPGAVDGAFTQETRSAIAAFQASRGQLASGYLNRDTVAALIAATGGQQAAGPEALIGEAVRGILDQLGR